MNLKPLGDRVVVKMVEAKEEIRSGLVIPDAAKEKPQEGEIVAIGDLAKDLKVGDIVLFEKYSGSKVKIEGKEYLIMHQDDVLGVVC